MRYVKVNCNDSICANTFGKYFAKPLFLEFTVFISLLFWIAVTTDRNYSDI